MCGIAGFLTRDWPEDAAARIKMMTDAIVRRGPDSAGRWLDPTAGIALGHRRLAIVDLSPAGYQPMRSASGRYQIVFNGEIYNHAEIRQTLAETGNAPEWCGSSDTETLVAGFDVWGIESTIARTVGMFAMAVWDRKKRQLTLVRDRLGEKPLIYGWQGAGAGSVFLFGSDLSAMQAHPNCQRSLSRAAVTQFMRHGHVGESNTIYEGLHKLPPGCSAVVSFDAPEVVITRYWSAVEVSERPVLRQSPPATIDALEALLSDAVGRQMVADVPLGAFLSGGVDSSVVVALMQAQSAQAVRTFSIGFNERRYDEAGFAKAVAEHLGTNHTELYVSDNDLRDLVPRLASVHDEPFADSSQIPTLLVSQLAREHVKVALSGDGGDELFCGYDRYRQGAALMQRVQWLPYPLRRMAAAFMRAIPPRGWDMALKSFRDVPEGKEPNGQRLHRLSEYLESSSVDELHRKLVSRWRHPDAVVMGAREPLSLLAELAPPPSYRPAEERMMLLDTLTYLPDDILTKVDRASMYVSLECRAPLLDHRVVEFAWGLPLSLKLRDGKSKWALRQVLYRHVPADLIERPKMGFEVPVGLWLRGPLRDWAEDLLTPASLDAGGVFNTVLVRQIWSEHQSGRFNHGLQLWNVLMFIAWQARQADQ